MTARKSCFNHLLQSSQSNFWHSSTSVDSLISLLVRACRCPYSMAVRISAWSCSHKFVKWGIRSVRKCWVIVLAAFLFSSQWRIFTPASAVPQVENHDDSNYTIFAYHLPESEEESLEDFGGKSFKNGAHGSEDYHNDTMSWSHRGITQPPAEPGDNIDKVLEFPEKDDKDEEETKGEEKTDADDGQEKDEDDSMVKDIVQKFLEQVEEYERNKANCSAGTHHNLGTGVIKQYGLNRFKAQAMVAVNQANFMSRIWKLAPPEILSSEYFFYTVVRSMLEGDPEIFAAGNCYDKGEFKDYYLFCAFAYRTASGLINVKDLSVEYDYLGNDSEWFYSARLRASNLENFNYTYGK